MGSDVGHIRAVLKEIFESAAIRRNAEMLVDGTELHAALVQVEADTGLPAAVLERAVAEPWALLSKAL